MLASFSNMETIHIAAYALLLETIGMPEAEFSAFMQYKAMADKHSYMQKFGVDTDADIARTLAMFGAFTEGLQLFASFAMLLNFPRFNKMKGMGQIVSWSVRDETLHCLSVIRLFRTFVQENPEIWTKELQRDITLICATIVEHEDSFIDLAFELGGVQGLDARQTKEYIRFIADRRLKAVAVMGGGMSVNDPLPWLDEEIAALRHLIKRDIPLIGHCLGGQLLARALGAEVRRLPYTEAGWQPMRKLTDSPWLEHVGDEFPIYQWHSDSFAIPQGATRLLASPWCDNQAFSWGHKVLGLQGHPEMTEALIHHWLETAGHLLDDGQDSQEERAVSISELPRKIAALKQVAEGFYRHWLALANG